MLLIMLVVFFFFSLLWPNIWPKQFKEGGVYSLLQFEEMDSTMVAEGTVVGD